MDNFVIMPLFAIPFYISEIQVSEQTRTSVFETELHRMEANNGDISTNTRILHSENFIELYNQIMDHVNFFTREHLHIDPSIQFELQNSWIVKHYKDDYADRHHHSNSVLSGIVYIETDEESGEIIFQKDGSYVNLWPITVDVPVINRNVFNSKQWTFKPKNNQIFLFPSHLAHSVTKCKSNNLRYCISFNLFPKGTLGIEHVEKLGTLELK